MKKDALKEGVHIVVSGIVPSKKNERVRSRHGHWYNTKQKEMDGIIFEMRAQAVAYKNLPLDGELWYSIKLFGNDRGDLDNQVSTLLDCIQAAGIIKNDRNLKHCVRQDKYIKKPYKAHIWIGEWDGYIGATKGIEGDMIMPSEVKE